MTIRFVFLVLAFLIIDNAYACRCWPPPVEEAYKNSVVIVHGDVVSKELVSFSHSIRTEMEEEIKERLKDDDRLYSRFNSNQVYKVTLTVKETYKGGDLPYTITIYTTTSDASCGYNFEVGKSYLIYSPKSVSAIRWFLSETERDNPQTILKQNSYWTDICTQTKQFTQSEADKLRLLH